MGAAKRIKNTLLTKAHHQNALTANSSKKNSLGSGQPLKLKSYTIVGCSVCVSLARATCFVSLQTCWLGPLQASQSCRPPILAQQCPERKALSPSPELRIPALTRRLFRKFRFHCVSLIFYCVEFWTVLWCFGYPGELNNRRFGKNCQRLRKLHFRCTYRFENIWVKHQTYVTHWNNVWATMSSRCQWHKQVLRNIEIHETYATPIIDAMSPP